MALTSALTRAPEGLAFVDVPSSGTSVAKAAIYTRRFQVNTERSAQRAISSIASTPRRRHHHKSHADVAATGTVASGTIPAADLAAANRADVTEVDPSLRMTAAAAVGEVAARVSTAPVD